MPGSTQLIERGETVFELPAGSLNHHWTKNLIASPDGSRLYVTVGSNSNVAENGIDKEMHRAAILEIDPKTKQMRVFATGLRNPTVSHGSRTPASSGPWSTSATRSAATSCPTI